jgi:hypothetical protein
MFRFFLYHQDLKQPVKITDPVGWDAMGRSYIRDPKWHGVFFEYTTRLQFVKEGKDIIHTLYETYGPEAEIIFISEERNITTRKWENYYTGRLNLMTLEISKLYATCNIENTGFVEKLKNRSDIKVNLQSLVDLDGNALTAYTPEYVNIPLHSKQIIKVFNDLGNLDDFEMPSPGLGKVYLFPSHTTSLDEIETRVSYPTQLIHNLDPVTNSMYLYKFDEAGSYQINIPALNQTLTNTHGGGVGGNWTLTYKLIYGKPDNYTTIVLAAVTVPRSQPIYLSTAYTETIDVIAGDELYLFGEFDSFNGLVGSSPQYNYYNYLTTTNAKNSITITGITSFPATNANMVLIHEAWARVCESIIGQKDCFRSNYYGRVDSDPHSYAADGEGSLRGILNGFQARNFPIAERPINASFRDLYETGVAVDGIGIGVKVISGKQYVIAEPLEEFYQPVEILRLDWVKEITKEVAEDNYYNELEIGYKKWADEQFNNLDEFNSLRQYSFPISQTKNKLTLVSPYIAGGYPLEQIRREQYIATATKDNENDQENFIIQLRRDGGGFITDIDQDFAVLNNVISPESIYNGKLSIGRCLRRNGRLIRSFLEKYLDKSIRLTFSQGNSKLVSRLNTESTSIDENADVQISTLPKSLWLPERYKFKAVLTNAQLKALNDNPYGYVSFSETNKDHKKAWIVKAEPAADYRELVFTGKRANV